MIKLKKLLLESLKLPQDINYIKLPIEKHKTIGYWISPNGKIYDVVDTHAEFANRFLYPHLDGGNARQQAIKDGWVRIRTYPEQKELEVQIKSINKIQEKIIREFAKRQSLKINIIKMNESIINESTHILKDEQEEGLIPVDNWKITHAMYLEDMGFKNDGMFYYALKKPSIRISYKRGAGFVVEDEDKKTKATFRKFGELETHFSNYKQKWENQPYL